MGLLKNGHLLRWAKNLVGQRTSKYASLLNFLSALHLAIFEQAPKTTFFNTSQMDLNAVKICPATLADLTAVAEIEKQVLPLPWSLKSFQEMYRLDSVKFWVAKFEEEVIGFMVCQFSGGQLDLHDLAVAPEYQHQGVGSWLLSFLLEQAQRLKIEAIYLLVRPSNYRARELYKKYGFSQFNVRRHYCTDNGEDALELKLQLNGKNGMRQKSR